jgi:hypothetical protein
LSNQPIKLRWIKTADFEIIQIYGNDMFGYAVNLTDPDLSEWGYCE